jgi:hypothetical protein
MVIWTSGAGSVLAGDAVFTADGICGTLGRDG